MRLEKILSALLNLPMLAISSPAFARPYFDPNATVFQDFQTWEIILYGIVMLALAGGFIFTLVKLITSFFGRK